MEWALDAAIAYLKSRRVIDAVRHVLAKVLAMLMVRRVAAPAYIVGTRILGMGENSGTCIQKRNKHTRELMNELVKPSPKHIVSAVLNHVQCPKDLMNQLMGLP